MHVWARGFAALALVIAAVTRTTRSAPTTTAAPATRTWLVTIGPVVAAIRAIGAIRIVSAFGIVRVFGRRTTRHGRTIHHDVAWPCRRLAAGGGGAFCECLAFCGGAVPTAAATPTP